MPRLAGKESNVPKLKSRLELTVLISILCPQAFSTTKLTCEIPKRGYGNDWYVLTMYVDSLKVNHDQKTLYYKVIM